MPLSPIRTPIEASTPTARRPLASRAIQVLAIIAGGTALSGCNMGILDPQGPVGAQEKMILIDSLAIMLAIVLPTIAATFGIAWWYRASNTRAKYLPDWAYSGRIELVVWAIPILTITLLGGVAWIGSHQLDPAKPLASTTKTLDVQVVSLDWKWLFIYPDQKVASVNKLVLPAGTPVHLTLTSASVMNAFFVPQLGSMIYTMNGMADNLHLQGDKIGTYPGLSAHYSGDGFSDMHFDTNVVSPADFQTWVDTSGKSKNALDAASYGQLARQSTNVAPATYRLDDPHLFDDVVTQKVAPGPGPDAAQPNGDVSPRAGG
jgi:cytochrome o ubiquinol oxidase subunit 2